MSVEESAVALVEVHRRLALAERSYQKAHARSQEARATLERVRRRRDAVRRELYALAGKEPQKQGRNQLCS